MIGKSKQVEKSSALEDAEGLEVDERVLRAEQSEKQAAYANGKEAPLAAVLTNDKYWLADNTFGASPISPLSPEQLKGLHSELPGTKPKRRICGVSSTLFWTLLALVFITLVIIGAIVGGVVGASAHKQQIRPSNETQSLSPSFPGARRADVKLDSPLAVTSYTVYSNATNPTNRQQEMRIYYQSLFGNVKESISRNAVWTTAQPIFTDAINHTGIATYTYQNGTDQTGAIFYVSAWGFLMEKRKVYSNNTQYWEVRGGIKKDSVSFPPNLASNGTDNDAGNAWDGYRLAAVYSKSFATGAGARLFYHAQASNGTTYVQELIWVQSADTWTPGAIIAGVNANSHLSATIDESIGVLRLYASTGNKSLQEFWYKISERNGQYTKTSRIDNILSANNAEVAAVSTNGTAYLYTYVPMSQTSTTPGIKELIINSTAKSDADRYQLNGPIIASPYLPAGNDASLYHSVGAALAIGPNNSTQFSLFYADTPTGDSKATEPGLKSLLQVSRAGSSATWPSGKQVPVDLGSEDYDPHAPT